MGIESESGLLRASLETVNEFDIEAQQIINRVQMIVQDLFNPNNPFSANSVRANVMPLFERLKSMGKKSELRDLKKFAKDCGLDLSE